MLTLEIRLLTGRYAAANVTDPTSAEWPPHPARVFSALTAALHEDIDPVEEEVRALEWIAEAGAPEIVASSSSKVAMRQMGSVFVPTNDQKALADIDLHIDRMTSADEALERAEEKVRTKAEMAVARARTTLVARSLASAEADGKGTPSNAAELLNRRLKPQPRHFPVAIPEDDVVHLQWPLPPPPGVAESIDRIAARVARLGHSSSLVSIRVISEPAEAGERQRWVPSDQGDHFLRVPLPRQLERLREAHERHRQLGPRLLPADPVRYADIDTDRNAAIPPTGAFSYRPDEWVLFEVVASSDRERRRLLDVSLAQQVARAMRGTLLRQLDFERSPPSLTGHAPDGAPTLVPHLAFVPLADMGHPHASGSILGLALVPPRDFEVGTRDLLLEAIYRAELEAAHAAEGVLDASSGPHPLRLTLGRRGTLHLRRLREPSLLKTLSVPRWTGPSRRWYTATAIALGRNPGDLRSRNSKKVEKAVEEAERTIIADCLNLGYPQPAAVWVHRRPLLHGTPSAHRFMPFPEQGDSPRRVCVHAEIVFDEPIRGPLILGAGRYFGIGLCAPILEDS